MQTTRTRRREQYAIVDVLEEPTRAWIANEGGESLEEDHERMWKVGHKQQEERVLSLDV